MRLTSTQWLPKALPTTTRLVYARPSPHWMHHHYLKFEMKSISVGLTTDTKPTGFTMSTFMWPINSAIEHGGSVLFTQVFFVASHTDLFN